jgi:hypothetical protein
MDDGKAERKFSVLTWECGGMTSLFLRDMSRPLSAVEKPSASDGIRIPPHLFPLPPGEDARLSVFCFFSDLATIPAPCFSKG